MRVSNALAKYIKYLAYCLLMSFCHVETLEDLTKHLVSKS